MSAARIYVCTMIRGGGLEAPLSVGYHLCRELASRSPAFLPIETHRYVGDGLVMGRSKAVRVAREYDATHLLFWDGDIFTQDPGQILRCLRAMLDAREDFVAAPYPKKLTQWDRVGKSVRDGNWTKFPDLESIAYDYAFNLDPEFDGRVKENFCTRVWHVGTGFMLLSRACMDRMWEAYLPELEYDCEGHEGCALFQPTLRKMSPTDSRRVLWPEDYSLCMRWRDIGGHCWMYVGPEAPLDHAGSAVFRGYPTRKQLESIEHNGAPAEIRLGVGA